MFTNINWRNLPTKKLFGLGLLAALFFAIAIWLLGFAFRTALRGTQSFDGMLQQQTIGMGVQSSKVAASRGMAEEVGLSTRNVILNDGYTTGTTAEAYEIKEYTAQYRTANLDKTCGAVEALKAKDYVIFENSNRYEKECGYTFKVENDHADEILTALDDLKPEELVANTQTIKGQVDDYTNEIDIQEKKLASVEETLGNAQKAYDDLTVLATSVRDVESLAKIIDSKLNLIERLTQQRIIIKQQIDLLNRAKAEQLDRLNFTFFHVSVYEFLIVDGKVLKDSWLAEVQNFVKEFNTIVQDITLNLAEYLMRLVQVAIYLILALFVVKYGWRFVRSMWKS